MNNEEREFISRFFERISTGNPQAGAGGSVPSTALPPIDPEADRFIAENFQKYPEARYRLTQMAVVQEVALAESQNRIRQLEWELQQAQQALAQRSSSLPSSSGSGGGFFAGLFGANRRPPQQQPPASGAMPPGWGNGPARQGVPPQQGYSPQAYPPPPGYQQQQGPYPPGYRPGMFHGGSGFLGSALTTAAGVAGGMMVGNALTSMFSGHGLGSGLASGAGPSALDPGLGADDPFAGATEEVNQDFSFDQGADEGGFDDSGWGMDDDSF